MKRIEGKATKITFGTASVTGREITYKCRFNPIGKFVMRLTHWVFLKEVIIVRQKSEK